MSSEQFSVMKIVAIAVDWVALVQTMMKLPVTRFVQMSRLQPWWYLQSNLKMLEMRQQS